MPIHYSKERYETLRRDTDAWWRGESDRPILGLVVWDAYPPDRETPKTPPLSQANCHDFSISPEEIIDTWDYYLCQREFLGDSYPFISLDCFGPGILSAFCGARLDNSSGGVWFFPEKELPTEEIHVKYDPNNKWARRIKDIYRAGMERWDGLVLMGMTDLGGNLDVAAELRGSENLLYDLYDAPDEVQRLCAEIDVAWKEAYDDLNSVLQPKNPGYSDWTGVYSSSPFYTLQCDFSYMIGTPMFEEFVLPSLRKSTHMLDHTLYHLDGIGALKHLDTLLTLDNLDAVQWIYGDGQPSGKHWIDVYQRIVAGGKSAQLIVNGVEDYDDIAAAVRPERLNYTIYTTKSDQALINRFTDPARAL